MASSSTIQLVNCVLAAIIIVGVNGARSTNRIVGGEPVDIANYPYQVSVMFKGQHYCGGVIIDKNWVLTAAHCIHQDSLHQYSIRSNSSFRSSGGVMHIVDPFDIIVHNQFSISTLDYDIALISVYNSLLLETSLAKPVSLPTHNQVFETGTPATVSGWGDFWYGGPGPEHLHAVQIPIFDHARCKQLNRGVKPVTERMICAGYDDGEKSPCKGDSGGPLVIKGVLAGIVSWGKDCGVPYKPGVYASVANLRQWIAENANI